MRHCNEDLPKTEDLPTELVVLPALCHPSTRSVCLIRRVGRRQCTGYSIFRSCARSSPALAAPLVIAEFVSRIAAELALFAGVGFLLFAINDLAVDIIYFARSIWRSLTVYTRYPRAFASYFVFNKDPGSSRSWFPHGMNPPLSRRC